MATKPILDGGVSLEHSPQSVVRGGLLSGSGAASFAEYLSRTRVKKLLFLGGDIAAVTAAHTLAELLARRSMNVPATFLNPSAYFVFYVPFFAVLLYLLEGYKSPDLRRPEKELELIFKGVSTAFVALACANFVLFKSLAFSRYLLVAWYVLALLLLLAARFGLRAVYGALWRRGWARQKALVVGAAEGFAEFEDRLAIQRYRGYQLAGIAAATEGGADAYACSLKVLGPMAEWEQIVETERVRLVIVRPGDGVINDAPVLAILRRCQEKGLDAEVYSRLFGGTDLRYERDEFSGCFRFYARPRWSRAWQIAVKMAMDLIIGLAGSVVAVLLIPAVAVLLKCEDGGPIFHWRSYIGTDGRVHRFLKFRTMVENADQILAQAPELQAEFARTFKLKDDPRVLKAGRFLRKYSLDEFPQFFSVLVGQLTFVGPRAITPEARERYGALLPKLLSMRPGLTGYWQVMGRQTTTYAEKIQMDMFYIEHWSIWLDLVIVAKTFWEVLRAKGAY